MRSTDLPQRQQGGAKSLSHAIRENYIHARLQLVGLACLHASGRRVALNAKDAALLALHVLEPTMLRADIACLIWPDSPQPQGNLRQRARKLRELCGCPVISVQGRSTLLMLGHDLGDPEEQWQADPAALPGELLGTLDWPDNPELSERMSQARQRWFSRRVRAFTLLADAHERAGRLDDALVCRQRLCDDLPHEEEPHQRLMELHHQRGERTQAAAAFAALRERLGKQLGVEPSPRLIALHRSIQATQTQTQTQTATCAPALPLLRPPRMVGRDSALKELAVSRSTGRTVLLMGAAGIGKTRLLGDYMASQDNGLVLRLRPALAQAPWSLLARLVRLLVAQRPQALSGLNAAARAQLACAVPELGTPASGPASPGAIVSAMHAAMTAAGVTALAIDDLQYGDAESLALLPELGGGAGEQAYAIWLLLAVRDTEIPAPVRAWLEQAGTEVQRLRLQPLSHTDVGEVLQSLGLAGANQPNLQSHLHRHCGGNPLFLLETLRALWNGECLGPVTGPTLPVPVHVGDLIRARLQALSPQAMQLAQIAALADEDFDVEIAAATLEQHPLELAGSWSALEQAQVLRDGAFVHDLLREAVLLSLEDARAVVRAVHGRLASVLASRGDTALLRAAWHWRCAERWAEAAAAYSEAARHAASARRRQDEARCWRDALVALQHIGDEAALLQAQAQSIESLLVTEGAEPALVLANNVLSSRAGPEVRATAALGKLQALALSAQFAAAAEWGPQVIALAATAGREDLRICASILLAQAQAQTGAPKQALVTVEALGDAASRLGVDRVTYELLASQSYLLRLNHRTPESLPLIEQAMAIADRMDDTQELFIMHSNRAVHLYELGRMTDALRDSRRAQALRASLGDQGAVHGGVADMYLGIIAMASGQLGEALEALQRAREGFERAGSPVWVRVAALNLSRLYLICGQLGRAEALLAGDWSSARSIHSMGRYVQLAWLARWRRRPAADLLNRAQVEALRSGLPQALPLLAIEQACHLPPEEAVPMLRDAGSTLWQLSYRAHAVHAWGRLIEKLTYLDSGLACEQARRYLAECGDSRAGDKQPVVWLAFARALRAGGQWETRERVLAEARAWMHAALLPSLPASHRESLQRENPEWRALVAEAAITQK